MKKLVTALVVLTLVAVLPASAGWTYAGSFPNDNYKGGSGAHGAAVSPDGKVWLQLFGGIDSAFDATANAWYRCLTIGVFNPDGSQASFSPIKWIRGTWGTDTLWTAPSARAVSNRGLRRAHDGNILISIFDRVYKVNYQTGAGMAKMIGIPNNSGVAVGVDTLGEVFVAPVVEAAGGIKIYDGQFNFLGNVTDTSRGFSRAFEVSKDGNNVYWAGYTRHAIYRYFSPNGSFGPYVLADTVAKGMDIESFCWNPTRTRLWISAGSTNDRPNQFPGVVTRYDVNTWYAWDPATNRVTDSLKWNFSFSTDSANIRPRAIAFSPNGTTAYVGCFGTGTIPAFQKFTFSNDVRENKGEVPTGFALEQNFPNPFNPTTEIRFSLVQSGMVSLKIYDMLGREVNTLIADNMSAGSYSVPFEAGTLSSGTYVYVLSQNGNTLSKKMLLLK